ncbi:MAG: hypothetical protein HZB26_26630 [Candidatus Hydrogenedentes bacterium]|nr:hypothetical protein [Candidatus Hydrogenedentota bacterium]
MTISALLVMAVTPYAAGEAAVMSIDAGKSATPISKYVYGQFIEHLGHCIYNGIWAEMLEDRKFYCAVGDKESLWKVVGDGAIVMDTSHPYVGAHSPAIPAGHGIVQEGLGLLAGRDYIGRIVLAGAGDVKVSLIWGSASEDRQTVSIDGLRDAFQKHDLRFTAKASTDTARFEITGSAPFRIGAVSLMPSDNVEGLRADVLALLKELDAPIYRWPGGNFVSGYDWRDGLGDPDLRPPRKNPAWRGVEHNDFGLHEFLRFCAILGTDPYIVVNSGQGDVQLARDEVEYVVGAASTPQGKLRARNGHTDPWCVEWWGVGNEMYGDWQLGHMPLGEYVKKHNQFADAMRAVDPKMKLIGVGATGEWSEAMLAQCSDHMNLLSEHFYCQDKPDVVEHVRQIPENVKG